MLEKINSYINNHLKRLLETQRRVYLEVLDSCLVIHSKTPDNDFGNIKGYKPYKVIPCTFNIHELVKDLREDFLVNYYKKDSNIILVRNFKN